MDGYQRNGGYTVGGRVSIYAGNGGGGGYTGGNGSIFGEGVVPCSGGGGGSFLADPNGTRQLDWYEEGNCSIEYVSK